MGEFMRLGSFGGHPMETHFIFQSLSCKIALMTVIHATAATIKLVFFIIGVDI
jgi:hypothetical protein